MRWLNPPAPPEPPAYRTAAVLLGSALLGALIALLIVHIEGGLSAAERPRTAVPAITRSGDRLLFAPASRPLATFPDGRRHPIDSLLRVPGRLSYGTFLWNESNVPAGQVWVRVDLDRQMISVFRGTHEIGTSLILYGADAKPTPLGAFPVLAKLKDHRSRTYGDAPMPYTMRLTKDGVAIHGSNVREGAATHGCVGVPSAFAAKMFNVIGLGDTVMIVRDGKSSARPS